MWDWINNAILIMCLCGLLGFGLLFFFYAVIGMIEAIVDAVKWVIGKLKTEPTDCYHCKYYDLANYWCNNHEDGRLMQETCEDGRSK